MLHRHLILASFLALGIAPLEDAYHYASQHVGARPLGPTNAASQFDASSFRDWRNSLNS